MSFDFVILRTVIFRIYFMFKYCPLLYLIFLINLISTQIVTAQDAPKFEMSYFEDISATLSFKSVQEKKFTPTKEKFINLGITKSALWIKIDLNRKVLDEETLIEVKTPLKDSITLFYTLKNNEIVRESLGVMFPYSKNKFNHYLPTFNVPIHDLATSIVYLKVTSRYSLFLPITVKSKEQFYKQRIDSYLIAGLLIGGLLLMGIYNLFLYFSTRDFSYLLYVLALFSAILSQGYLFGILIPYLSPESPEFSFRFPIIIMSFTGIFSALFAIRFLTIKRTSTFLYYLLLFFITLLVFNITLELMKFDYLSRKLNIFLIIGISTVIFSSAVYSLIKKNKIALYFTIAWTFYLFGMIVFALKSIGVLSHNTFTDHFMHFGTFLEVILLSFALGHKYSLVQVEKERLENQTREELEALVKLQTTKLETSLGEKEVLLKEIHHRVKNNLQIVISLLDLQVASIQGTKNKEILLQSKSRVYSMSLIHQKLYQSDNLARINMKNYLEELFPYLKDSYYTGLSKIDYSITIENKDMSLTKAVPLGLIVNELLANSFKYGLKNAINNKIEIVLEQHNKNWILQIADSGKGFDQTTLKQDIKKSLGLFLVSSLTKQLHGTIKRYYKEELFVTELTIPIEE